MPDESMPPAVNAKECEIFQISEPGAACIPKEAKDKAAQKDTLRPPNKQHTTKRRNIVDSVDIKLHRGKQKEVLSTAIV